MARRRIRVKEFNEHSFDWKITVVCPQCGKDPEVKGHGDYSLILCDCGYQNTIDHSIIAIAKVVILKHETPT